MQTDLFVDARPAKERLFEWMKGKVWVKTSEVLEWGTKNFSNRALRNAQQLAAEGKIRRMDEGLKQLRFGDIKEGVWEIV